MPRTKPSTVMVQRFELGDFERKQIKEVAETAKVLKLGLAGSAIVGAGALAVSAYALWWFLDSREEIVQRAKDAIRATPFIVDEDDPMVYDFAGPMPIIILRGVQRVFGLL
jgi:hypothetical protein